MSTKRRILVGDSHASGLAAAAARAGVPFVASQAFSGQRTSTIAESGWAGAHSAGMDEVWVVSSGNDRAPDNLEPHVRSLQQQPWASALLGFVVGALVHLVMDLPNPSGIRFLHPFRQRVTLNWWRGDQMVWPMVWFSWLAGALSLHWAGLINLQPPLQLQAWLLQVWDLSLQRLRS